MVNLLTEQIPLSEEELSVPQYFQTPGNGPQAGSRVAPPSQLAHFGTISNLGHHPFGRTTRPTSLIPLPNSFRGSCHAGAWIFERSPKFVDAHHLHRAMMRGSSGAQFALREMQ